jgi:hypothetical protein
MTDILVPAAKIREAHTPRRVRSCGGQYPDRRHVDFGSAGDYGMVPSQNVAGGKMVSVDDLVVCDECLTAAAGCSASVTRPKRSSDRPAQRAPDGHRPAAREGARRAREAEGRGQRGRAGQAPAGQAPQAGVTVAARSRGAEHRRRGPRRRRTPDGRHRRWARRRRYRRWWRRLRCRPALRRHTRRRAPHEDAVGRRRGRHGPRGIAVNASGHVLTAVQNFPATQAVSDGGGSLTVDGTVTANAGTGPWPVTDNGGTLSVDDAREV